MNLDELQSVQARERQSSDLQHLRSSFYQEVGEFINSLNEERARVVEAADDPFSEPEVRRLTDDIETAEGTVEAIYERRVGKVVKKASIAAAGMPIEDDGLTNEEEALFEDLVARIEQNRETVLSVLDGEGPSVSCSIDDESAGAQTARSPDSPEDDKSAANRPSAADNQPASPDPGTSTNEGGVSAADLMGDGAETASEAASTDDVPKSPPDPGSTSGSKGSAVPPTISADREEVDGGSNASAADGVSAADGPDPDDTENRERDRIPGLPRTTVRITADIGQIVGADDRDYDLGTEDVVTLPEPNAEVLVKKNAAERL